MLITNQIANQYKAIFDNNKPAQITYNTRKALSQDTVSFSSSLKEQIAEKIQTKQAEKEKIESAEKLEIKMKQQQFETLMLSVYKDPEIQALTMDEIQYLERMALNYVMEKRMNPEQKPDIILAKFNDKQIELLAQANSTYDDYGMNGKRNGQCNASDYVSPQEKFFMEKLMKLLLHTDFDVKQAQINILNTLKKLKTFNEKPFWSWSKPKPAEIKATLEQLKVETKKLKETLEKEKQLIKEKNELIQLSANSNKTKEFIKNSIKNVTENEITEIIQHLDTITALVEQETEKTNPKQIKLDKILSTSKCLNYRFRTPNQIALDKMYLMPTG